MPVDGALQVKRFDRLKADASNYLTKCERMAPLISPSRMGIITQREPGFNQAANVYDSTTIMAAELMAHFLAGHIINLSQRWVGLEMKDPRIAKNDAVREWCEESRDRLLKHVAASMFYSEGPEALIDYGGFGTGFLLAEERPQPSNETLRGFRGFYFRAEKTGRFIIAEGSDGLVDTAFREYVTTARVVHDLWRERASEKVRRAVEENRPDTPVRMLHAITPRPKAEQGAGSRGMPWAAAWIEHDSKHVCHEGGYRKFPAAVPRMYRTPGEIFGRGRGDIAFPDAWTLNTAKRYALEDWALKIKPPVMLRHDSVIGSIKLTPGGPTSVRVPAGQSLQDVIKPWETGSHPEVNALKEEELRKSIRQIFYVEQILALLQVEKSEMTAYEFSKKIELLFRILGPVYGRLEWEFLYRIVDVCFDIMQEAGAFSPPPPEAFDSDGQVDIVFHNPLAKAQRAGDAESLTLVVNDLAPIAQIFPQVWDRIDPDKTAIGIMDNRGFPAMWTRSDKEFNALRAAREQQETKELQTADTAQFAESAGKVAPLLKVFADAGKK